MTYEPDAPELEEEPGAQVCRRDRMSAIDWSFSRIWRRRCSLWLDRAIRFRFRFAFRVGG